MVDDGVEEAVKLVTMADVASSREIGQSSKFGFDVDFGICLH